MFSLLDVILYEQQDEQKSLLHLSFSISLINEDKQNNSLDLDVLYKEHLFISFL